jgi:hypothetical protein
LLQGGGKEVSRDFNAANHSSKASELAKTFIIGVLGPSDLTTT